MAKRPLFFVFLALCAGIWICETFHIPFLFEPILPANHIKNFTSQEPVDVYIIARIITDPVVQRASYGRQKTAFTAKAISFGPDQIRICGFFNVASYDDRDTGLEYNDTILIKGVLSKPLAFKNPGCFDYEKYLARQGIYSFVIVNKGDFISVINKDESKISLRGIFRFKRRLLAIIDKYIPGDEADILRGVLLGDRSLIEKDLKDKFVKTGTVHILVVSGLNVGLIASIFLLTFKVFYLPRYVSYSLACILIALYAVLSGANAPVVRAAIMAIALMAGVLFYRRVDILNCLGLSGIIILLKNPYVLFDPGFQLSFLAIISIIILAQKIKGGYLKQSVVVSAAAWFGIIPIIAYNFNIISPICILANIPVVFIVFLITAGGMAFLAAGLFAPFLAGIFAGAIEFLTYILIKIVVLFSKVPFGFFWTHKWGALEIISFYIALGAFCLFLYKKEFRKSFVIIAALVFLNISVWQGIFQSTKYKLQITILDVGHGDAIVLEFAGGGCALIDTGKKSAEVDIGESVVGPYLRSRRIGKIDAIFITHTDDDHAGGLRFLLKNFKVARVYGPDNLAFGDTITGFKDVQILVLNPQEKISSQGKYDKNNNSLVLKLTCGSDSFLFCGDIGEEAMKGLLPCARFIKSDVIKIPHHGSAIGAAQKEFLHLVSARIAVISASRKDVSQNLLDYLYNSMKCKVYRTYKDGAVVFVLRSGQILLEI